MERYICIHGHFYQPPRENPWLEAVEMQDSAAPYHDWNERVTAECYAPNTSARILDPEGRIESIVNNYEKISFDFGPTLLAWIKENSPEVYHAILQADERSRERFSGHGSALAQAYNHLILPLANARDKRTQVVWGFRDFESRFGRPPEGMWLPETAVDMESLEVLAAFDIKFTILSPSQASRIRRIGEAQWTDVQGGAIDPTRPYQVKLPSGRTIAIFFYVAPVSQAVAFEGILENGERFVQRLLDEFNDARDWNQLVHIATDGESYGHHHRNGEMALAYALHAIETQDNARLTNYGEYLERHPPTHEVEISEGTSWSCAHGLERWRSACGCNSGLRPGWKQTWRSSLRKAFDWLRDRLAPRFEKQTNKYLKNAWRARDEYISVILDRSAESLERFFAGEDGIDLDMPDRINCLRLLEMQRNAMLMYTSCGWFFDDLSGIETVQCIQYAARAIQLGHDLFGEDFESEFLRLLSQAKSNLPEHRNGRRIYERFVKPAIVNRERVGAHFAISSLFEDYPTQSRIYAFSFDQEDRQVFTAGRARLAVGQVRVTFEITHTYDVLTYAVLHLGDHNLNGGVRQFQGPEAYQTLVKELSEPFGRADFPQIIREMDRHFGKSNYSLKSLFRDEQRKILSQILASTEADLENRFQMITDRYTPLMRFLTDLGAPLPLGLQSAADYVLNVELVRQFDSAQPDFGRIRVLLEEGHARSVTWHEDSLSFVIKGCFERLMERFASNPEDLLLLSKLDELAAVLPDLPFEINLWKSQNIFFELLKSALPTFRDKADQDLEMAQAWLAHFNSLGEKLGFGVR